MKKREICIIVVLILLLAILIFIFSNSLEPVASSEAISLSVMERFAPMLEIFVGKGNVTVNIVRKLAHFTEFAMLGMGLMIFSVLRFKTRFQNISNSLSFGLAAAVTDEALQMLTDRGPMAKDILLDFTGVLSGVLIVLLTLVLTKLVRAKTKHRQKGNVIFK